MVQSLGLALCSRRRNTLLSRFDASPVGARFIAPKDLHAGPNRPRPTASTTIMDKKKRKHSFRIPKGIVVLISVDDYPFKLSHFLRPHSSFLNPKS